MFTKVSEQRSTARRYALRKAAAGPTYNTGGWAPPAVARIPKTETPSYFPGRYFPLVGRTIRESAGVAVNSPGYVSCTKLLDLPEYEPVRMRAEADPRYGNWLAAHNEALDGLPTNGKDSPVYVDLSKLPETRKALAGAYHRKMYELTNGVPTRASAIYTR